MQCQHAMSEQRKGVVNENEFKDYKNQVDLSREIAIQRLTNGANLEDVVAEAASVVEAYSGLSCSLIEAG
jgi:hypothetical protein